MLSNIVPLETVIVESSAPHPARDWWLYLLACSDGRTYAGVAIDVDARFRMHLRGKGAKFTRANRPNAILGAQLLTSKSAALKAEHVLKQMSRVEKMIWAERFPYAKRT